MTYEVHPLPVQYKKESYWTDMLFAKLFLQNSMRVYQFWARQSCLHHCCTPSISPTFGWIELICGRLIVSKYKLLSTNSTPFSDTASGTRPICIGNVLQLTRESLMYVASTYEVPKWQAKTVDGVKLLHDVYTVLPFVFAPPKEGIKSFGAGL